MKSILLIGLGRFGRHIAEELNKLGHEVMAVDENEDRVNEMCIRDRSGGSCRFRMIAALTARDRLFTHANTAQTDSAIVPDFQREMVSVLVYRQIAASATPARAKTVEA